MKKQRTDRNSSPDSLCAANVSPASVAPANVPKPSEDVVQITSYQVVKRTEPTAATPKGPEPSRPIGNFPLPSMSCPESTIASRTLEYLTMKLGSTGLYVAAARTLPVGLCIGQLNDKAREMGSVVAEGSRIVQVSPEMVVSLGTSESWSDSELSFMKSSTSTLPANVIVHPNGTVHVTTEIGAQQGIICDMVMPTHTPSCTVTSIAEIVISGNHWVRLASLPGTEEGVKQKHVKVMTSETDHNKPHVNLSTSQASKHGMLTCLSNYSDLAVPVRIGDLVTIIPSAQCILFPSVYPAQEIGLSRSLTETLHVLASCQSLWPEIIGNLSFSDIVPQSLRRMNAQAELIPVRNPFKLRINATSVSRTSRADLAFQLETPPSSYDEGVEIRASNITGAGSGLFACHDLKKGDPAGSYRGELMHFDEWKAPGGNKDYGLNVPHDLGYSNSYMVDGFIDFGESKGRFINEGSTNSENNVHPKWHSTSSTSGFIYFAAKKAIPQGTEILYEYGAGYPRHWLP